MFIIKHFVATGIHLGQKTNQWNPRTAWYLFAASPTAGTRIHIIDLEQTILMFRRAMTLINKIHSRQGFLLCWPPMPHGWQQLMEHGGAPQCRDAAPGTPTCPLGSAVGEEVVSVRLGPQEDGAKWHEMPGIMRPKALFILKASRKGGSVLIREAMKWGIPVIAIINSDTDPAGIQYPIPGNDDSICMDAYIQLVARGLEGASLRDHPFEQR